MGERCKRNLKYHFRLPRALMLGKETRQLDMKESHRHMYGCTARMTSSENGTFMWPGEVGQDFREGAEPSWFFWEPFWTMYIENSKLLCEGRIGTVQESTVRELCQSKWRSFQLVRMERKIGLVEWVKL